MSQHFVWKHQYYMLHNNSYKQMNELMNLDVMEVFVDTDKQIMPNMNKRERYVYTNKIVKSDHHTMSYVIM